MLVAGGEASVNASLHFPCRGGIGHAYRRRSPRWPFHLTERFVAFKRSAARAALERGEARQSRLGVRASPLRIAAQRSSQRAARSVLNPVARCRDALLLVIPCFSLARHGQERQWL
eukprot:GHVU01056140.1.p2 GENE.GHVU01056140.1~~GHVU01056140.1.p2  ORF type:complete len:116 (+),score=5.15 GHVU01056140.1:24-371(+)